MAHSYCTTCEINFTSLSAFDKHLEGIEPVTHLDPNELDLEWSETNQGWKNKDHGQFDKLKNNNSNEPPKEYACATCGSAFTKQPGRGRPPKNCIPCGGKGIPVDPTPSEEKDDVIDVESRSNEDEDESEE